MDRLSKSDFKVGCQCPFKLKYSKSRYPSTKNDNAMLKFFAEGGYMVEAIAHAVMQSNPDVVFEKDLVFERYYARADAFETTGDRITLTEIKAKSTDSGDPEQFFTKAKEIRSEWRDYLVDITFQVMVAEYQYPNKEVIPQLCLVNKNKTVGIDAIYSKIDLSLHQSGQGFAEPHAVYTGDVHSLRANHFLEFINVRKCVDKLMDEVKLKSTELLQFLTGKLPNVRPQLGVSNCKSCEYRGSSLVPNGFNECWGAEIEEAHVIDLYFAGNGSPELKEEMTRRIENRDLHLADFPEELMGTSASHLPARRNQLRAARSGNEVIDSNLITELEKLQFPLHFIDFEASQIPVPYVAGMKPYERIAFQLSCHSLSTPASNDLVHREWLNLNDVYPNQEFLRELRLSIGDTGTVLVWSHYEKSTIKGIRGQLEVRGLLTEDTKTWIDEFEKRIVDLLVLSQRNYCHPKMNGSHSIKKVLDAVWASAPHLWSDPWFAKYYQLTDDGQPLDPYQTLLIPDLDLAKQLDETDDSDDRGVTDGVGAMRAYQDILYGLNRDNLKLRDSMKDALLRYCELDTAAMVMIWKHWHHQLQGSQ
jgi:hypothetical protein